MAFIRIKDIHGDNHHVNTAHIKTIYEYDIDQNETRYVVALFDGSMINTDHRYIMEAIKTLNILR